MVSQLPGKVLGTLFANVSGIKLASFADRFSLENIRVSISRNTKKKKKLPKEMVTALIMMKPASLLVTMAHLEIDLLLTCTTRMRLVRCGHVSPTSSPPRTFLMCAASASPAVLARFKAV